MVLGEGDRKKRGDCLEVSSQDSGIVIIGNQPVPLGEWVPVLYKEGVFKPLFPGLVSSISGSKDEAIDRARIALGQSERLRKRWAGSWVVPVNFQDGFKLGRGGEL